MNKLKTLLIALALLTFGFAQDGIPVFEADLYGGTIIDSLEFYANGGADKLTIRYDSGEDEWDIYSPTSTTIDIPGLVVSGYFHLTNNDADDISDGSTNVMFLATERTKLTGIEASAKDDQTGAEIKSLYELEANTNAYTDAEKTKLSGIESSATGDQTGAEIKALYEAEANTNAYTDTEKTKLSGIETSATADQDASEILTLIKTVDGTGSGLDADLLDGQSILYFATSADLVSHATGTGADHTYIDQLLTTVASPTFDQPNFKAIDLDTLENGATQPGQFRWNSDDGTVDLGLYNGVVMQIGQELPFLVKNESGSEIPDGRIVMYAGSVGASGKMKVLPLIADGTIAGAYIIGATTQAIPNNDWGYVISMGRIRGIPTNGTAVGETWSANDVLYPNPDYNGNFSNVQHEADSLRMPLAIVSVVNASSGELIFRTNSGSSLSSANDVQITSIANNEFIQYNSANNRWENLVPDAEDILIAQNGASTYDDIQDWMNNTQSSGITSGGTFTTNGDGSVTVSAGTGMIRATNSALAKVMFFDWAENASVSLTDDNTNYIYVDYNSGSPIVVSTLTKTDADNRSKILLGKVFRHGTDVHLVEAGMVTQELAKLVLTYLNNVNGEVVRASGFVVGETGNRYLTTTNGVLQAGLTTLSTTGINTSGTDVFTYYYYSGTAWVEGDSTQIDSLNYNNIASGLVALTANRYGVHWIYGTNDGELLVVYGQGDYTLAGAESAQPPTTLPEHVSDFSFLASKAIVKKGSATVDELLSAYDVQFNPSLASDHGDLAGLIDDDHTQYILHTELDAFSEAQSQIADKTLINEEDAITLDALLTAGAGISSKNGATSAGWIDLYEDSDAGTNYTRIITPALVANVVLTLPINDGDANQVLHTDGSGNLSWDTDDGAGASGTISKIEEGGVQVGGSDITLLNFPLGFDITEPVDTEITVTFDPSEIAGHDLFTDFVANEHIDWTSDQGAINIHAGNYTDTNTQNTYTGGDAITITAFDIDFDGGATPSGDLGGTWASISVNDDSHNHIYSNIDATTSANWAGVITDETGTGLMVFNDQPVFTTNITIPLIIGGTSTTQDLSFKTTSGIGATGADMHFLVGNNGATEAITILNDGKVGIGTSSPTYLLDVVGNLKVNTTDGLGAYILNSTNTTGYHGLKVETTNTDAGTLIAYFRSGGVDKLVVRSNGSVGIGTDSPAHLLDVHKTTGNATMRIDSDDAHALLYLDSGSGTGDISGYYLSEVGIPKIFMGYNAGTNVFSFYDEVSVSNLFEYTVATQEVEFDGGSVGIGMNPTNALDISGSGTYTGTWTDASDIRLKTNLLPINNALNGLMSLNTFSFEGIETQTDTLIQNGKIKIKKGMKYSDGREYGVSAQEVQKVFPELVSVLDPNSEKQYLGVNYIGLIPILIEAVKEQQLQIDNLTKRIEKLEKP